MANVAKKNGNGRVTDAMRILAAWKSSDQNWPPSMGDKVKLFSPKDLRGKSAKVIAYGDVMTKPSTRKAPKDKARVVVKHPVMGPTQLAVAQGQVFPNEFKLKDLDTII